MSRAQAPSSAPEEAGFTLHTERLGPLPLINHFIERIGLHETLSRFVPSDQRCAISHASALGVLLRSIIVEREPIYRQQETVHGFADGMFGISAVSGKAAAFFSSRDEFSTISRIDISERCKWKRTSAGIWIWTGGVRCWGASLRAARRSAGSVVARDFVPTAFVAGGQGWRRRARVLLGS
jgi:hypothetical protein